jgi:hypothetical protein
VVCALFRIFDPRAPVAKKLVEKKKGDLPGIPEMSFASKQQKVY